MDKIIIKGARENNLKNIDLELPKNKLIVMTGVSGSGKSSLAFDTIYAEGERRYIESLSAYARQFLGGSDKPDVDSIEGLSPSISIDQKTTNNNPRSTVGTVTEIYDYLRLLFARVGTPYCPNHHVPITSQSIEEMTNKILAMDEGTKLEILAPIVHGEKGTHQDLFDDLRKKGFTRVRVNGEMHDLSENIDLEKNKKDNIYLVVDRIVVNPDERSRIFEAIELSTKMASGKVLIHVIDGEEFIMSEHYACPECNFSLPELEPRLFSFNAPYGACPECKGLGVKQNISIDLLIPDKNKSVYEGAIKGFSLDQNIALTELETVCKYYNIDLNKKISELSKKELDIILYGSNELFDFEYVSKNGNKRYVTDTYEGIANNFQRRYMETTSKWIRDWLSSYMVDLPCKKCHGARLSEDVLAVKINGLSIYEVCLKSIRDLIDFFDNLKLTKEQENIASLIVKEIKNRLSFLNNVGLGYLTLAREASTLSGGESQRIRLATQIGSKLTGVLYVLDEPSIGLHQRDNDKLIATLKKLRDLGNTLLIVEHDEDTMYAADQIIDIGPGAGVHGGKVMAQGTAEEVKLVKDSVTGQYLSGRKKIEVPKTRRKPIKSKVIEVKNATENNLKNISVKFPLGVFTCVTGVSGSGKSTLVNEVLYKTIAKELNGASEKPGKCKEIKGLENIDKIINIDQSPIGRTPRSNPATYTGVFDLIRDIFAGTNEAKLRGFQKGRFSFNVAGGRCESCNGDGVHKIEMHFLPDVYVPCEVCKGKRYNRETLEVKYKGKSIADVLDMTVEESLEFFDKIPKIKQKIQTLYDVGLGYIKLGQPSTTLSGGEAQRVKLATELSKRATGKTLYILDEPTTGLHIADVHRLVDILQRLVDTGNTIIVIEHNLDLIKTCDHIIDLGPEGGDGGGQVVAVGTPEQICKNEQSYTGKFLKKYLND